MYSKFHQLLVILLAHNYQPVKVEMNEILGILMLGPTAMGIRDGLKVITSNDNSGGKYTIGMYIFRSVLNTAIQFIEIQSNFSQDEIVNIIFKKLKYTLPCREKINKRNNNPENNPFSIKSTVLN